MSKLLITGGTGSYGNAVLRKFLESNVFDEIRSLNRNEKEQDDMRRLYQDRKIRYSIGYTRNPNIIKQEMQRIDMVFHAAALKQLPSSEFFQIETVQINLVGITNVLVLITIEPGENIKYTRFPGWDIQPPFYLPNPHTSRMKNYRSVINHFFQPLSFPTHIHLQ